MARNQPARVLVLDNGAYCIKAGVSNSKTVRVIPNCIMKAKHERRRPFIGDQIEDCRDASGLFYILAFQKGYLINWDIQKSVWDYVFGKDVYNINYSNTSVLVTEPVFNFSSIQEGMTEIFLEEYEFHSIYRTNASSLSAYRYQLERPAESCCLIVDAGYSFTYIVPYCKGRKLKDGIRRIDVGGKLLTNHLKEIVSYRQLNVMDETYVVNQLKEDTCFVSQDFKHDMAVTKQRGTQNTICRDYVLPDYTTIRRGYMKGQDDKPVDGEQVVRMNNERFTVPELLFHPSDVGISQMGIPEAIVESISSLPECFRHHLYRNILLTGGCAKFNGFRDRIYKDLRSLAPIEYTVKVFLTEDSISYAWQGGCQLGSSENYASQILTRKQYEEKGYQAFTDLFDV